MTPYRYTIDQLASLLGVTRQAVQDHISAGRLKASRGRPGRGTRTQIAAGDALQFVERRARKRKGPYGNPYRHALPLIHRDMRAAKAADRILEGHPTP